MSKSTAENPDLDWSQVKETVKLLTVSVAQLENSMREGDLSVNTLTLSFTDIVDHLQGISRQLDTLAECSEKQAIKDHRAAIDLRVQASLVAFQFYDRLQQRLHHVMLSLKELSLLIDTPGRLYNPMEWKHLQDSIRSQYTMEAEKLMFDAILQGKSLEEALASVEAIHPHEQSQDEIELF